METKNRFRLFVKIFLTGLLFHAVSGQSTAQEIRAFARLDTNKILIGDHVKLELLLQRPAASKITFPVVPDSLSKIEILNRLQVRQFVNFPTDS